MAFRLPAAQSTKDIFYKPGTNWVPGNHIKLQLQTVLGLTDSHGL